MHNRSWIVWVNNSILFNTIRKKVIVLEKNNIGEKVSGNTTGKITSQHDLFYTHLIDDYGEEYAKKYLEANEQAIANIKQITTASMTLYVIELNGIG